MSKLTFEARKPTICIDVDGVIADYSEGFKGPDVIGPPLYGAKEFLEELREAWKVIIHTTRGTDVTREYMDKHELPYDEINDNSDLRGENPGKPIAALYLDDRAVCFRGDFAQALAEIEHFRVWYDKKNIPGIVVQYRHSEQKGFTGMKITGHAGLYPGRDPLCGAVSFAGYALIGTLANIVGLEYIKQEYEECIDVRIVPLQDEAKKTAVNIVFETILIGLKQLALGYPEHITIEKV